MSRLPFDPKKVTGPEEHTADRPARREARTYKALGEAERLTVSQLAELIKSTLEQRIPSPLRVIGEISNLSAKNHLYFSLKDESAVVSCVAWASSAKKFRFTPKDGDEVLATGHVSHYPPQGRTQLYVTDLKPIGAGALEQQFRAMCRELRELGYFDEARKKPLPVLPRRIAVITSAEGAAVHDVVSTAAQRCRAVALLVVDVLVQGEGAADDVARAIRWVDRHHARLGVDAILVTRGGGSLEDLWAFNERKVADAAFACSIPLVAAIGHESDTTVIELVADLRAATPTQAAMRLVPSSEELARQVDHLSDRLLFLVTRRVEQAAERLRLLTRHEIIREPAAFVGRRREHAQALHRDLASTFRVKLAQDRARFERLVGRLSSLQPLVLVGHRNERLAVLADRLDGAVRRRLDRRAVLASAEQRLNHALMRCVRDRRRFLAARERELLAVDPREVLKRGFSYTTDVRDDLVRSVRDVRTGDRMFTHVADGSIESVVGPAGRRPPRGGHPTAHRPDSEQMDLFGLSG